MIPTCEPCITAEDRAAVSRALEAGHVAVGPEVEAFEEAIAARTGIPYAVAVSSGSAALQLAMHLLGAGVPVRVPALTFIATAEAVLHARCPLEIVDHGEPADISVNFYGHPPVHEATIEDACEGLGSAPLGRAIVTALSFNGNKMITTGGGGMLLTRDQGLADALRQYASHCRTDSVQYVHAGPGFNARMPAMNAALGLSQLARLDDHLASKRATMEHYRAMGVPLHQPAPGTTSSWWMPLAVLSILARSAIKALQAQDIMVRPVWYPLPLQPSLDRYWNDCPVATHLWRYGLLLPCSVGITAGERQQVVEALDRGGFFQAPPS